jgi:hypothetical protein
MAIKLKIPYFYGLQLVRLLIKDGNHNYKAPTQSAGSARSSLILCEL